MAESSLPRDDRNVEHPASPASNLGLGPLSVRYVCRLLRLQAVLWAVAALCVGVLWITSMAMTWAPIDWTYSRLVWYLVAGICFIVTGGLSAGSAVLATGLARGSAVARIAVVVLEFFMVAFGWLVASYTATGQGFIDPGLPAGLGGGALSLAAAICLLSKPARRFSRRGRQTAAG
jgi:hypothetical protein